MNENERSYRRYNESYKREREGERRSWKELEQ